MIDFIKKRSQKYNFYSFSLSHKNLKNIISIHFCFPTLTSDLKTLLYDIMNHQKEFLCNLKTSIQDIKQLFKVEN